MSHLETSSLLGTLACEIDNRYRDVVARMPAAVWTARMNGEILFANDQIEGITGFSPAEIVSGGAELWARRVHPADIGSLFDKWNEIYTRGEGSLESEYRFLRKDAQWVWLQQRISLVVEKGREPYTIGIATDVTAKRMAEEGLRSSELRYRTLVDQVRDVIFAVDTEGRFQSLNPAFETLTGFTCEEWTGRTFFDLFQPASLPLALKHFQAALSGQRGESTEYEVRTKSGGSITIEASSEVVECEGQAIGTVGIARNVTGRKQAEAEAARASRLAGVGQLATSVAHEFNNVLMSIMPFAELLQRRFAGDEGATTATRHILEAVRRGREISQQVLRFSRPAKTEIKHINVAAWLHGFNAEATLGTSIRVERRIAAADRELIISADRSLLDQVVTNLLTNARDAMPNGGKVILSVRRSREPRRVDIVVEDAGGGMRESVIDHIFEPLFTTKHGASGLGLTVAYQAMKQQDGTISVESTVGAGSTFTLSFCESESSVPSSSPAIPATAKRILIVDDDEAVAEGLRLLLDDEGFEVEVATCGTDTVPAVSRFRPDLVLLDLNLPDASGVEVYERILEVAQHTRVIFSTGQTDQRALEEVRRRNVPSIMKPYDIDQLLAVIGNVAEWH